MKRKNIVLIAVFCLLALFLFAACGEDPGETHTHTFDSSVWEKDGTGHWHPATCEHKSEKGEFAAHTWNEGVVDPAPTATKAGVKTTTCTICSFCKTETVPALGAEQNEVSIDVSALENVTYDKKAHGISAEQVTRKGSGAITVTYKAKGAPDTEYSEAKPVNAGEYVVRAQVAATEDFLAGEATADFRIASLKLTPTGLSKTYDGTANFEADLTEGVLKGDTVHLVVVTVSADVGDVAAQTATLQGEGSANYTVEASALTVQINPIVLNASFSVEKVYDGTDKISHTFQEKDGVLSGTITAEFTVPSADVTNYKFVYNPTYELRGEGTQNYQLKFLKNSLSQEDYLQYRITQKPLGIPEDIRYYAQLQFGMMEIYTFTTADGLIEGDACDLKANVPSEFGNERGYYTLTKEQQATILSCTNDNYSFQNESNKEIVIVITSHPSGTPESKMRVTSVEQSDEADTVILYGQVVKDFFAVGESYYFTGMEETFTVAEIGVQYGTEYRTMEEGNVGDVVRVKVTGSRAKEVQLHGAAAFAKEETVSTNLVKTYVVWETDYPRLDSSAEVSLLYDGEIIAFTYMKIWNESGFLDSRGKETVTFELEKPIAVKKAKATNYRPPYDVKNYFKVVDKNGKVLTNAYYCYVYSYELEHSESANYTGTCDFCGKVVTPCIQMYNVVSYKADYQRATLKNLVVGETKILCTTEDLPSGNYQVWMRKSGESKVEAENVKVYDSSGNLRSKNSSGYYSLGGKTYIVFTIEESLLNVVEVDVQAQST